MLFNDFDCGYKRPIGAVRAGQQVYFTIPGNCDSAVLSVWEDGQDGSPSLFPMQKDGSNFEICHTFDREGLYFYNFRLSDNRVIGANESGEGLQQTVYSDSYAAPQGYAGGVMYQIFPDRFNIGGGVLETPFGDRIIHTDADEMPYFRPDGAGKVKNSDYFGGNLLGIEQKLPYLAGLGVSCIYLNPICEAHSNHRYDTACYRRLDPLLGSENDFRRLCQKAHKTGIRLVLDGVFSHTGADSEYFNKYGRYDTLGAYQSCESEYYSWYKFERYPNRYKSWWGFEILPELNEEDEGFVQYICGEGGAIDYWMSLGADGFRLDVADELPDPFIEQIRAAVKRHGSNKILIGEVWEDASNKVSYGFRRRFLYGNELDSVMNYPFRTAVLDFIREADAELFMSRIFGIIKNYPKPMLDIMMNMLSTHDTERAVNALVFGCDRPLDREQQAEMLIKDGDYLRGVEMLKLATVLQFTLPGIPCIYYGDEIGMQGMRDPFNRRFMRWHAADNNLLKFFQEISLIRRAHTSFEDGEFIPVCAENSVVAFLRRNERETVAVVLNRSETKQGVELPGGEKISVEPWRYAIRTVTGI